MLTLKIENGDNVLACASQENEVTLTYIPQYEPGDCLTVECDQDNVALILQLDDAMYPAYVYLTQNKYSFSIPFEDKRISYSPRAFTGTHHVLYARIANADEISERKNLAFNPWDCHENQSLFPHSQANVETRGEAVFASRNAIDGIKASHDHGVWPFQSWGINQNPNAELKIDFGREVIIDEAAIYLRADFPHDAWWEKATLSFSDGNDLEVSLIKTPLKQAFEFPAKTVRWVLLHKLIKADDPSVFPALTQIEFYGTEK